MIIAFSGTSGSGKSTLIDGAKKLGIFSNKTVSVKEEDNFYPTRWVEKALGTDRFEECRTALFMNADFSRWPPLVRPLVPYIYSFVVYTELLSDFIKYELIYRDRVVIKDRYIYDYLVTLNENVDFNNRFINYLFKKFPRPYLTFFVDVERRVALERNKENKVWMNHTGTRAGHHKRVLKKYRQISKEKNLIRLDNNKDLKASLKIIEESLLAKKRLENIKQVVICGIDGTGKTTLANRFRAYCNSLNVKSKIVHPYHNTLLYQLLLMVGILKKEPESKETYNKNRATAKKVNKKGKPFIWGLLHYIDFYVQHLFFVFYYRKRILVFDRYFYDSIVGFKLYRIGGRRFFERLIPNVKNKFCLVCEPEVAYKRKPENTLDYFRSCHNEYQRLANKHGLEVIDTTNTGIDSTFELFLTKLKNDKPKARY